MSEITIKVDVPEESKEEFKRALAKIIEELSDKARIKDFNDNKFLKPKDQVHIAVNSVINLF